MSGRKPPPILLKTAAVTREAGLRFRAETGSGHSIVLDDASGNAGPRPAELLVLALAGCTAMDVISVLEKQRQVVTRYEVRVTAQQRDAHPRVFTGVDVVHIIDGPTVGADAVRRAIELSATRYCTANATFSAGPSSVRHRYLIRGTGGDGVQELAGDVITTGPHADPDDLARGQSGVVRAAIRRSLRRPHSPRRTGGT